jgi:hypothetical protein
MAAPVFDPTVVDPTVEFLAMVTERMTALERRVDSVSNLEARFEAYKAVMPRPLAYYVELEQPPWSSADERSARLLTVRRAVMGAVASVTKRLPTEMHVSAFLAKAHEKPIAVVFITCGSCGPTHDAGDMYMAISACGVRVKRWDTILQDVEATYYKTQVSDDTAYIPIRCEDALPPCVYETLASRDTDVGFYRLAPNIVAVDDEDTERAEEWALVTNFKHFIQCAECSDNE